MKHFKEVNIVASKLVRKSLKNLRFNADSAKR